MRFGAQLSLERRHGGAGSYELSAVIAHHGKKVRVMARGRIWVGVGVGVGVGLPVDAP